MQEDAELQRQIDGTMKPEKMNGMRYDPAAFRHGVLQNAERGEPMWCISLTGRLDTSR
jgi:hypothetical protein